MLICYTGMRRMGGFKLPKLFMVCGIWLTKSGGCILASNGSKISKKELNELMEFISAQFFFICAKWKEAFVTDEIGFYC